MPAWEGDGAHQHPAKFLHHRCGCGDYAANICFAGAIFGQGFSLHEVWHLFQYLSIRGNVDTAIVYVVHNAIGPFCADYHDAGTCNQWFCQVL